MMKSTIKSNPKDPVLEAVLEAFWKVSADARVSMHDSNLPTAIDGFTSVAYLGS
jgi:hypothetical protein